MNKLLSLFILLLIISNVISIEITVVNDGGDVLFPTTPTPTCFFIRYVIASDPSGISLVTTTLTHEFVADYSNIVNKTTRIIKFQFEGAPGSSGSMLFQIENGLSATLDHFLPYQCLQMPSLEFILTSDPEYGFFNYDLSQFVYIQYYQLNLQTPSPKQPLSFQCISASGFFSCEVKFLYDLEIPLLKVIFKMNDNVIYFSDRNLTNGIEFMIFDWTTAPHSLYIKSDLISNSEYLSNGVIDHIETNGFITDRIVLMGNYSTKPLNFFFYSLGPTSYDYNILKSLIVYGNPTNFTVYSSSSFAPSTTYNFLFINQSTIQSIDLVTGGLELNQNLVKPIIKSNNNNNKNRNSKTKSSSKIPLLGGVQSTITPVIDSCTILGYQNRILSFDVVSLGVGSNLISIQAADDNGIQLITIGSVIELSSLNLVSGNICVGTYQFIYNDLDFENHEQFEIILTNSLSVVASYYPGDYYSSIPPLRLPNYLPNSYLPITIDNILDIEFSKNDIDLSSSNIDIVMYIKVAISDPNLLFKFWFSRAWEIKDPESSKPTIFYGLWDSDQGLYRIDFTLPARMLTGEVYYQFLGSDIDNTILEQKFGTKAKLRVKSSYAHQFGAEIKDVNPVPSYLVNVPLSSNGTEFGFSFNIISVNGFKSAQVAMYSDFEFSVLFTITPNDKVLGTKYSGSYSIKTKLPGTCKSQMFEFQVISIIDEANNEMEKDALVQSSQVSILCSSQSITTLPIVSSWLSVGLITNGPNYEINTMSFNRTFSVNVTVNDDEGILVQNLPLMKISPVVPSTFDDIYVQSILLSSNKVSATILYTVTLPIGYGYPNGINVHSGSIYDQQNNVLTDFLPAISTIYTPILTSTFVEITGTSQFTTLGGGLFIYGYGISLVGTTVYWDEKRANSFILVPSDNYLNSTIVRGITLPSGIAEPFNIKIQSQNMESNIYTVIPLVIPGYVPTTPSSTIKPPTCQGSPPCGGASNGECLPTGCKCIDPWIGNDCLSRQIIIPRPNINTTAPETPIDYNGTLPNGEKVEFSTLISFEELREIDVNGDVIHSYIFSNWIFTNISTQNISSYHYSTNITKPNQLLSINENMNYNDQLEEEITTTINITLQWFESASNITFADDIIEMKGSTMKYNIQIDSYPFSSQLNQLEIIMSATMQDNSEQSDSCSLLEFDTSSQNNEIDYVKLQINSQSLYGRFIKKGIIDNRVTVIKNEILQSSNDEQQTSKKTYSKIGTIIPHYKNKVYLDPDFSILVDSTPASEKTNSICEPKSNKLSKAQLVGIIIGSVGFAAVAITAISYYIYKKKQYVNMAKSLNRKLNLNQ